MTQSDSTTRLNLAYKHAFGGEAGAVVLEHLRRRFLHNPLTLQSGVQAADKALMDAGAKAVVLEIEHRLKAAQEVLKQS